MKRCELGHGRRHHETTWIRVHSGIRPALEPKMKRYILTRPQRYLHHRFRQTLVTSSEPMSSSRKPFAHGGSILFIGTKKQAQEAVAQEAKRVGSPLSPRWLGACITNFTPCTSGCSGSRMESDGADGGFRVLPKRVLMLPGKETSLERTLGGIRDAKVPSAVWIVDTKKNDRC